MWLEGFVIRIKFNLYWEKDGFNLNKYIKVSKMECRSLCENEY